MADYVELNPGAGGGDQIAADEISGVKHQRVKIQHGVDGSATDVSSSSPLPVIVSTNPGVDIGDVAINNAISAPVPIIPGTGATIDTSDVTITNAAGSPVYIAPGTGVSLNTSSVTISNILTSIPAGINNIGQVELATGTNYIGYASVYQSTDIIYNGAVPLTPKMIGVGGNTSGNNTLVAAVTSKKIRILSIFLISAGTVNMYIEDSTTGTNIIGTNTFPIPLVANSGFQLGLNQFGHGETVAGEALVMVLSAAVAVSGCITYIEV